MFLTEYDEAKHMANEREIGREEGREEERKKSKVEWIKAYDEIIGMAEKYAVQKIVLFGSRARGTNTEVSDIDIVIYGAKDFKRLYAELKYNEFTLKMIDIINGEKSMTQELKEEIRRDGVVLYEKGR